MGKITEYNQKETAREKELRFSKAKTTIDQAFESAKLAVNKMPDGLDKQKALHILSKYEIK
jgi:hypothetical protein